MVVGILTIFIGALSAAAGTQELVVQGILNNQLVPLTGGTLGAVAGALMLSAGVALVRESPRAASLTTAAAISSLAVTALVGMLGWGLAGWPMTMVRSAVAALPAVPRAGRSQGARSQFHDAHRRSLRGARARPGRTLDRRVRRPPVGVVSARALGHRAGVAGPRARFPCHQRHAGRLWRLVFCLANTASMAGRALGRVGLGHCREHQRHRSSSVVAPARRIHAWSRHRANSAGPGAHPCAPAARWVGDVVMTRPHDPTGTGTRSRRGASRERTGFRRS